MSPSSSSLQSLSTEVISAMMPLLLSEGFEDFFNFFIAWARAQRPIVIVQLLNEFPLPTLYKLGQSGSPVDVACFDRFMHIGVRLRIPDAMLYTHCRDIFCGDGNIADHLVVLDRLASEGHFLSMVANFFFRIFCQRNETVSTLHALLKIYNHPGYERKIAPAINYLQDIQFNVGVRKIVFKARVDACCPIHVMGPQLSFSMEIPMKEECLFCSIANMVNMVSSTEADM